MRRTLAVMVVLYSSLSFGQLAGSQSSSPQTARQALLELFFGEAPNHMEKHLPELTKKSLNKFGGPGGRNYFSEFAMLAAQIRREGKKLETFDSGPVLVRAEDPRPGANEPDKIELTVERDDLIGDENQIELALHLSRNEKEQDLPVIPRFLFSMRSEANVWKLFEIAVTVRIPLGDPVFLKTLEDHQRSQNEMISMSMLRMVNGAEKNYSSAKGRYACSLSLLGSQYLYDPELAKGSKYGYNFVISSCDGSHYKLVAEPAVGDSEQRAFCSDETGEIRASADGKATTCLSSGEVVEKAMGETASGLAAAMAEGGSSENASTRAVPVQPQPAQSAKPLPTRVRVSQGVAAGLKVSDVTPVYPVEAKAAGIQGAVVLAAVIGKDGSVESVKVVSSPSEALSKAATDAVSQWKYRPYLLQGNPVEVDTRITVNFALSR